MANSSGHCIGAFGLLLCSACVSAGQDSGQAYSALLDEGIDWSICSKTDLDQERPTAAEESTEAPSQWAVDADQATADGNSKTADFAGQVEATRSGERILAEDIHYDHVTGQFSNLGAIFLENSDIRLIGRQMDYLTEQRQGSVHDAEYRIPDLRIRGQAGLVQLDGPNLMHFENITYTTCPPGNAGYVVTADELDVQRDEGLGTFKGATVRFLDIPLFYVPELTIPIDGRRRSGLLPPRVEFSNKNGFDYTQPYYLNLAPNYDATLYPRIISERGIALGGEFRFITEDHSGKMIGEILPYDRSYEPGGARGAFHMDSHSTLFTEDLTADIKLNYISDDDYLNDIGDSLAMKSMRFLPNQAGLSYQQESWELVADVLEYKTLDETLSPSSRPYSQLPRIRFNGGLDELPFGFEASLWAEYIDFYKEDFVSGQRFDLLPEVSLPMRGAWWHLIPSASARFTQYQLDPSAKSRDERMDRTLHSLNLDGGLYFDKQSEWFGTATTQTLEPRFFYTYTPYREQSDIPIFDTSPLDFNFDNLFRSNRFAGPDRVGDANQVTLALSSSLMSQDNGYEYGRASIGQVFFFDEQLVSMPRKKPTDFSKSSWVAQVSTSPTEDWLLRVGAQYDPNDDDKPWQQGLAQATWRSDDGHRINAAYRLREGEVEQTDFGGIWPISPNISLIARWYYSILDSQTLETMAGIEYGDCCWRVRAVARHYLDDDGEEYNDGLLLELELNGLGKLGNDLDAYLNRTIYGY